MRQKLAELRGLTNGDWATIVSPRGVIEAQVLVTGRVQKLKINGEDFHLCFDDATWRDDGRPIAVGQTTQLRELL